MACSGHMLCGPRSFSVHPSLDPLEPANAALMPNNHTFLNLEHCISNLALPQRCFPLLSYRLRLALSSSLFCLFALSSAII